MLPLMVAYAKTNFAPAQSVPYGRFLPACKYYSFLQSRLQVVIAGLDSGPEAVHALTEYLSPEERRRADRFRFDRDRRRFIVARARLRQLLGERVKARPEEVELVYGSHGKPALSQRLNNMDWRFNVSHRDDVAAYVFSQGREVGIDVEAIRPVHRADTIASHFFSRSEQEAYLALDSSDKMPGFFNCWTRKEAFIKAIGLGISHPLDCFDVSLAPGDPARLLRVKDTPGADAGWHLDSFSPLPGFVVSMVSECRG
ncbi:MAG: 4'-phosphopantetheinyl transferase superfamily protein [Prolixibacteraceae bacterium]|nr:4'-phosphopantetheinyl transferase superfamily protein [Burkholderiales bacterium]